MKKLKFLQKLFSTGIFLFMATYALGQSKMAAGTVTDNETGDPLIGVTVQVSGHPTLGTITQSDGTFKIEVPQDAQELTFSFVGYNNQTAPISENMNIKLVSGENLKEVVVIGYGTQKASDVSTAISTVQAKSFNKGNVVNPIEQINGKVPGLVITKPSGDPNQNLSIRLRGQASLTGGQSPLIVLDGVPLDDPNIIASIPPGDIASYNVLKDASATAIYGSRGANGVIIIETKKGSSGATTLTYSGQVGFSRLAKDYDMLNAEEWKQASINAGADQQTIDGLDHGGNTNWMRALTRTAFTTSHNIGISGGANGFNYFGSVDYRNQQGIILNTGRNQVGINFNGEKKALDDKLDVKIGIVQTSTNMKLVDQSIFPAQENSLPVYPVKNPDGTYFAYSDFEQFNPVEHQEEQYNRGKEQLSMIHGTVDYNLSNLITGLSVGVTGSLSRYTIDSNYFQPQFPVEGNFNNARKSTLHRDSKKGDIHLNYSNNWGDHHLDATLVHEYSDFQMDDYNAAGREFLVEGNLANALENGNPQFNEIFSYKEEFQLSSFLGRASYNYKGKYYANASFRRDGSSKFGANHRWGNFPAFSLAWRMSSENFMQDISWINELKLRGGYGVTGNQDAIDAYRSQRLLGNVGRYFDGQSGTYKIAYGPTQNENPDLRWEEVHGMNIGLDFALFNRRLTGNFNYFHNTTKHLLFNYKVPTPPFFVDNILANVGTMLNQGEEVQLFGDLVKTKNFKWTANGQITFLKTRITNLSGSFRGFDVSTNNVQAGEAEGRGLSDFVITYLRVGNAPFTFFLPHYVGIDADGNQLFDDGKGGTVTQGDLTTDMYHYIDPSPKFSYGIGSTLDYKNWELNFFMRGLSGQKIFDNSRLNIDNITRLPGGNVTRRGVNSGIKDGPMPSDLWLEKAGFLRMENLTLSYSFKEILGVKNIQLSAIANNLFVLTPYKGLDPEIRVADTNQAYIDANKGTDGYYPRDRSFMFAVDVNF